MMMSHRMTAPRATASAAQPLQRPASLARPTSRCLAVARRTSDAALSSSKRQVQARNMGGMSPAALEEAMKDPKMREAMQEAMKNPKFMEQMKQMQQAMQNPETAKQMQQMQTYMQNQGLQERMKSLKDDPEFADMFADIQKNGMGAMTKYYNDPEFLAKLGDKIRDVVPEGEDGVVSPPTLGGAQQRAPVEEQEVEINNILDASKYGDLEAVEDFVAIGKDVNMADEEKRTSLHYACAYAHGEIARLLMEEGALLEAQDSKGNTPLHYAAGYGRPSLVSLMIDAGANKGAKNGSGKTAAELVAQNPQNPINSDAEVLAKLKL